MGREDGQYRHHNNRHHHHHHHRHKSTSSYGRGNSGGHCNHPHQHRGSSPSSSLSGSHQNLRNDSYDNQQQQQITSQSNSFPPLQFNQPQIYFDQTQLNTPFIPTNPQNDNQQNFMSLQYNPQIQIQPQPQISNQQHFGSNPNLNSTINTQSLEQSLPAAALSSLHLPPSQITETGIIPNTPYYELPASLMAPLIASSQKEYKPLNPADLRLPLPKFPDENFLRSIDSYYLSDSKLRDNDGWNREFIDIFISQKDALANCENSATAK